VGKSGAFAEPSLLYHAGWRGETQVMQDGPLRAWRQPGVCLFPAQGGDKSVTAMGLTRRWHLLVPCACQTGAGTATKEEEFMRFCQTHGPRIEKNEGAGRLERTSPVERIKSMDSTLDQRT